MHDVYKYAVTEYMWKSEDSSLELIFSFHLCGLETELWLHGEHFNLLDFT